MRRKKIVAEMEQWWERNKDRTRVEILCDVAVNRKIRWTSRARAIEELAELGDKSATSSLIQCINAENLEHDTIAALAEIGDERAIPHIKNCLKDDDVTLRRAATIALLKFGDNSGVPVMIKSLSSWEKHT